MDSLRTFFSYSADDKKIVGMLKEQLEFMGFEVFLAHDDIEPSVEWQDEIIKNLKSCDIFIPLLTKSFRESFWTDQETGIAVATDKFIISLQVDFPPYGFIGKKQGLKIDTYYLRNEDGQTVNKYLKNIATKIFNTIRTQSKFGDEELKRFFINRFISSKSYYEANARAKLLEDFPDYTPEQVHQIFNATIDNRKIYDGYTARKVLTKFFKKYLNLTEEDIINLWS